MAADISPPRRYPKDNEEDDLLVMEQVFSNEDLSIELLTHLPAKTLLRFMCVSKGWQSIISEVSFSRTHVKTSKPTVSGLFCQENIHPLEKDVPSINYISVDSNETSIYNTILEFLPEKVVLLSSSNGLLHCRSHVNGYLIYICNPSNKEYLTLERVWEQKYRVNTTSLAFDPVHDANFKLVSFYMTLGDGENGFGMYYCFDVYSSKSREWKAIGRSCLFNFIRFNNQGIYANGFLHWLTYTEKLLIFDVINEEPGSVDVPPGVQFNCSPEPQMCIGESEGCLHYINVAEERLEDWVLTVMKSGPEWKLKHSKSFVSIAQKYPHVELWINTTPLAFKDGLLFMTMGSHIYS